MTEREKDFTPTEESSEEKISEVLSRIDGLEDTLHRWCNVFSEEDAPLSFEQVVGHIADNREVREAVKLFLSPGGRGYERDEDPANRMREELAWALVEELEKRSSTSE